MASPPGPFSFELVMRALALAVMVVCSFAGSPTAYLGNI